MIRKVDESEIPPEVVEPKPDYFTVDALERFTAFFRGEDAIAHTNDVTAPGKLAAQSEFNFMPWDEVFADLVAKKLEKEN